MQLWDNLRNTTKGTPIDIDHLRRKILLEVIRGLIFLAGSWAPEYYMPLVTPKVGTCYTGHTSWVKTAGRFCHLAETLPPPKETGSRGREEERIFGCLISPNWRSRYLYTYTWSRAMKRTINVLAPATSHEQKEKQSRWSWEEIQYSMSFYKPRVVKEEPTARWKVTERVDDEYFMERYDIQLSSG